MPAFDGNDRSPGVLPAELEGKSPLEIAQYYQTRERELIVRQSAGNPLPPPPPPPISRETFDADPLAATREMINRDSVSREEFARMTQAAQSNLVASAKMITSQGKEYWVRLLPQLTSLAQNADPMDTIRPEWWETTYNYLVGQNLQTLRAEEAERVRSGATHEGSGGVPQPPPAPHVLSEAEQHVAAGLGISEEGWRKGLERVQDGRLPVTLDNRRVA